MTAPRTLRSVLIANRGEIACRIIRTLRSLNIRSVAVYSDADRDALHVQLADEAWHIGGAAPAESYLRQDRLLELCARHGIDALHPGYGFLSENAGFAHACEQAGVIFIGPPSSAIEAMGSKSAAKALMAAAGVPLIPGYHGDIQDDATLLAEAERIGYPLLIKAAFGGGGKGMRVVSARSEFTEALHSCRREARASFGDDTVLLERYLTEPRHVEIQVFFDAHGNGVYLHERDCSIQRRHQKIIEEAPAPGLPIDTRARMGEAALAAGRAIGYRGAGTIEFLLDVDGRFYFMEMNTRLQVEHPVTEYITGLDLVEWQVRVARGEPLPLTQDAIPLLGHAIEARICAESPERQFMPSIGTLEQLTLPVSHPAVRVDTGVREGSAITAWYDPMIAKLIVHGATREEARHRMLQALSEFQVRGVDTNVHYLHRIMSLEAFAAARLTTRFLTLEQEALNGEAWAPGVDHYLQAALALLLAEPAGERLWDCRAGWQLNAPTRRRIRLAAPDGSPVTLEIEPLDGRYQVHTHGEVFDVMAHWQDGVLTVCGSRRHRVSAHVNAQRVVLFIDGAPREFAVYHPRYGQSAAESGGRLTAPMPGRIVQVMVKAGDAVAQGQSLLILEAMKMEHTLKAPMDGTVEALHARVGDAVREGMELIAIHAADKES